MFLGEYKTSFTGQGRVVLPKKFRSELGSGKTVILSRGFEGCIWGFDTKAWEKEAEKQLEISSADQEARNLRRYLFSAAESVDLDDQGRFVIPKVLLEYAGLTREEKGNDGVIMIGAGDHFEVWDSLRWHKLIHKLVSKG